MSTPRLFTRTELVLLKVGNEVGFRLVTLLLISGQGPPDVPSLWVKRWCHTATAPFSRRA